MKRTRTVSLFSERVLSFDSETLRAGIAGLRTEAGGGNAQPDSPCSRAIHAELPRPQRGQGEMKTRLSTADGAGIVGFGHYVPYQRVDMKVFSEQWGVPAQLERMYRLNGRNRVAVNAADEDTVTLALFGRRACAPYPYPRRRADRIASRGLGEPSLRGSSPRR